MTDQIAIEATIRAYAAAWAARDREAWLRTFAMDATQEDPVGDPVRRGHNEIGGFWDREMARYQFIKLIPREVFVIGREAVMVWTINGVTPEGAVSFDGVAPDFQLTVVRVELRAQKPEPAREWVSLPAAAGKVPGELVVDTQGHFPVDRVKLALPQPNTVAQIQLSTRERAEEPWRFAGSVRLIERSMRRSIRTPSIRHYLRAG